MPPPESVATAVQALPVGALRLRIDPASLGFADTTELQHEPLPWIGQERAQTAARFGLALDQPHTHLFVLGDVGTGRSTLLEQEMRAVAATRPVPPDLCYLHHFAAPERPRAAARGWAAHLHADRRAGRAADRRGHGGAGP